MRRLENQVRHVLTFDLLKTNRGEDLRDVIATKLQENNLVNNGWNILSRNMDNIKLSNVLKNQVINKWIDIRANAFVLCYIQVIKRAIGEKKLSKKAEPALRKTLS